MHKLVLRNAKGGVMMFGNFGSVDRGASAYAQANGAATAYAQANGTAYAQAYGTGAPAYGAGPVAGYGYGAAPTPRAAGRGFTLIIVLFILLVIIGASWTAS